MRDDCIIWAGAKNRAGYGLAYRDGKHTTAHRIVLADKIGRSLTTDEYACHHCDNPSCVNPEHLFVGSPKDNAGDMIAKGRANFSKTPEQNSKISVGVKHAYADGRLSVRRGEASASSKITESDVREIRASSLSQRKLAAKYGISQRAIGMIVRRETWAHVTRCPALLDELETLRAGEKSRG